MAKELVIKVKVDGQEINVAEKSIAQLTSQIDGLKAKLQTVPLGSAEFKKIQGDINNLESGFRKAKDSVQPFMQSMGQLPGALGYVGRSIQGVKEGFDLLMENPLVAVFAALAAIVVKVGEKLSQLEGVMDPLEKIGKAVSGVFDVLANTVLPPIAALLEGIAEGVAKVANFFGELVGAGQKVGDNMTYVAETMDRLNDTNAAFELSQAKANRQLREAREIAADSTKSVAERVSALKDADKIERQIAAAARERELLKAKAQAVELANSLQLSQAQIDAIQQYDAVQLESFLNEIQQRKALNREKSDQLYQTLGKIQDIAAQEAMIGKKTAAQITSVQREEHTKQVEAAKKAAEQKKDFEKRLADFQFDTRLQNTKDEQEKARMSLENDKTKTLTEISNLEMSEKRKKQLKEAAIADFDAKSKALALKQSEETTKKRQEEEKAEREFGYKVDEIHIAAIKDETERNKKAREQKYNKDVDAMYKDTQFLKLSAEEQNKILTDLKKSYNNDIDKINEDAAEKERQKELKRLDEHIKLIQMQQSALIKGTQSFYASQRELLQASEEKELKDLDDRAIKEKMKAEDVEQQKTAIKKKYVKQRKDLDKDELNSYLDVSSKIAGMANNILGGLLKANQDKMNNELQAAGDNQEKQEAIKKSYFEKNKQLQIGQAYIATFQAAIQAYQAMAGIPIVGPILGGIAAAAAIYFGIQQVNAIKDTQYQSSSSASGSSASPPAPPNLGKNYGSGGMIDGPSHSQGGVPINAEGGEAVMTRGSVTMFGPLLSALNQAGGGTAFNMPVIEGSHNDNPKTNLGQSSNTIIKTYVVSSELRTEQQKQARLKDLSTL